MSDFPCTKCGLCCHLAGMREDFPFDTLPDGRCSKLTEEGLCSVYDDRPDICNLDRMYERYKEKEPTVTKEDYHANQAEACNWLIANSDIEDKEAYYVPLAEDDIF